MIDNVTKEGKTASGYIVAAGSMFVLGAAIPNHTGRCRTITLTLQSSNMAPTFHRAPW
jgi:hypothetical protein